MNKLTPYEQSLSEQLKDVPMPPEETAWRQMNKLLDENNNDGTIAAAPIRRGCSILPFLIALLLLGGGIYFLTHQDMFKNNAPKAVAEEKASKDQAHDIAGVDVKDEKNPYPDSPVNDGQAGSMDKGETYKGENARSIKVENPDKKSETSSTGADNVSINSTVLKDPKTSGRKITTMDNIAENKKSTGGINDDIKNTRPASGNQTPKFHSDVPVIRNKNKIAKEKNKNEKKGSLVYVTAGLNKRKKNVNDKGRSNIIITEAETDNQDQATNNNLKEPVLSQITDDTMNKAGSISETTVKKPDSLKIAVSETPDSNSVTKKRDIKKKKFHFGAGIGIYKGIPLNGEIDVAVNNAGRKNAISDYLPSFYTRFYREKKWFIQGELRFGVPQYTKGFAYKQNLKTDAFQNQTTSIYKLRKTYYHQASLSFNYFILPGWSVGTGIVYNKFKGAISTESVHSRNLRAVNDSVVSFKVINDKNDSSFAKNSVQWLIETQYKWRRFSVGARFAQGLQPYIHYTDPVTNLATSKKNNSLHLFLRYEFWSSKKK